MKGALTLRQPRVCFLAEAFLPISGGQEIHCYQLADKLVSKGLDLFVLTRRIDSASPASERIGNVQVQRFPPHGMLKGQGWKAPGKNAAVFARAFTLLVRFAPRYDVILVSGFRLFSIPAILVSKLGRKRCVLKLESPANLWEGVPLDATHRTSLMAVFKVLRRGLLRLTRVVRTPLIRRADALVAISSEIRQQLLALGVDPTRIHSIPNGIDTNKFCPVVRDAKPDLRRRLSLPPDKAILIFTGRLAKTKGVLLLVELWREIVRDFDDVHLVFVGAGANSFDDCEQELKDYIREHRLEGRTTLTGGVDNVHEYLQASDLFVFPTEHEGFSLALTEALACGLPALATRVGAAPEVVEDGRSGVLVPPKEPQAMREAMQWLLRHRDQWSAMGARARQAVEERYSLDVVAEAYIRLFEDLCGAKR